MRLTNEQCIEKKQTYEPLNEKRSTAFEAYERPTFEGPVQRSSLVEKFNIQADIIRPTVDDHKYSSMVSPPSLRIASN